MPAKAAKFKIRNLFIMRKTAYKLLLLSIGWVIGFPEVFAQKLSDQKRHFVSFNTGLSSPIGNYKSTSGDNVGMAIIGYNLDFHGAYYLKPYFGIGGNIGYFANNLNHDGMRPLIDKAYPYNQYNAVLGNWKNTYFLAGPQFSLPLNSLTFDLKLLCGVSRTSSPSIHVTNSDDTYELSQSAGTANAFTYNLGIGARMNFSKRWAFRLYIDYMHSDPHITTSRNYNTASGYIISSKNFAYDSAITVINWGGGVAYQFVK